MAQKLRSAILCGGAGSRLWPLSRVEVPKQFHSLVGNQSLLTETVLRAKAISAGLPPIVITGQGFGEIARQHAAAAGEPDVEVILEPAPRNTAPAAALAALAAAEEDPATIVALLASDHHIADEAGFQAAIEAAQALAADGALVTLGIVPDSPHTGYGYIRRGAALGPAGYRVDKFIEKPDAETAGTFFKDDRYYWNAGIFIFRADVYLRELGAYRPDILEAATRAWKGARQTAEGIIVDEAAWAACPSESIDYAVAEPTTHAAVVPADIGWNDVGSWSSLMDIAKRDDSGNAVFGDVSVLSSRECYVRSTSRHVTVIGASDLIVVETDDAILIVHKDATQQVKRAAELFNSTKKVLAAQ